MPIEAASFFNENTAQNNVNKIPDMMQYGNKRINELIKIFTMPARLPTGKIMFFKALIKKMLKKGRKAIRIWEKIINLIFSFILSENLPI